MYLDEALLYEQGYMVSVNNMADPLFYLFDYDARSVRANMNFQHFHQFCEIFILLNDHAAHIIEGDCYPLQPYDIVLLRPSLLHKTEYPAGDEHRRLVINFRLPEYGPEMSDWYRECMEPFNAEVPIYRFSGELRTQLFDHINNIFRLGKKPQTPLNQFSIHCQFMEFLCVLAKHARENTYRAQNFSDSITQKVYAVTSFIHHNYEKELSLEILSKNFYISPYYLSHQFREVTGFSLINYIQITRVRNAQQMLLYTNMKITDISNRCGFTSFSQFNRVFNKFCHASPSQFRANGVVTPIPAIPYEKTPSPGSTKLEDLFVEVD